ncbi:MAG: hypothetical protein JWQ43_1618 [Glaciihabitans sp.]|nr:hypothetical protein [Glaciihabitans sp.]
MSLDGSTGPRNNGQDSHAGSGSGITVTTTTSTVVTPTLGRTVRRAVFWVAALLFIIIVGLISLGLTGSSQDAERLSPGSPSPAGSKAIAEVLRQQGVDVTGSTSLADTERLAEAAGAANTTIALYDDAALLSSDQLQQLGTLADTIVLIEPSFTSLQALAPGVAAAGSVSGGLPDDDASADAEADADANNGPVECTLPAVEAAGTVSGDAEGYRLVDSDTTGTGTGALVGACLPSGEDVYSLVQLDVDDATRIVIGTGDALTNEGVVLEGNAALALGLLGSTDTLVWYLPSLADVESSAPPTLGELSPDWVVPTMALAGIVALAAAFWRGRRFGPLVVENLPVVVRASETMEGRARLYERNSARLRALDALRIGGVQRLATLCGLPMAATVEQVLLAVADLTGIPQAEVRGTLLDDIPRTDAELVSLSDKLLLLERTVAEKLRPA